MEIGCRVNTRPSPGGRSSPASLGPDWGASSGVTARVTNEPELRAALANTAVTNIEVLNDIDVTTDATTLDLVIGRGVSISSDSSTSRELTANALTITGNGVTLSHLVIPNAVTVPGADNLLIMNTSLGGNGPAFAITITGGDTTRIWDSRIAGSVGVKAQTGAFVQLRGCTVTAASGAIVTGATMELEDGTFHSTALGVNVADGLLDIDGTLFLSATGVTMNTTGTGNSLTIDGARFESADLGVALTGTVAPYVAITDTLFVASDVGIDFGYAFAAWTATLTGNSFFGDELSDIGIRATTASSTPSLKTTWQGANTFLSYGSGKDIVYP